MVRARYRIMKVSPRRAGGRRQANCSTGRSVVQSRPNTGSGGISQEDAMAVTVQPITPSFAAEVGDVDLGQPLGAEDISAIKAAFTQYAVLVFPDQTFDDESHLAFARHFGP